MHKIIIYYVVIYYSYSTQMVKLTERTNQLGLKNVFFIFLKFIFNKKYFFYIKALPKFTWEF